MHVHILAPAREYLSTLSQKERYNIEAELTWLGSNNFTTLRTKQLKGPVYELITGNHRFTYFKLEVTTFLVRGFRKKTRKTPPVEIEYAETIYNLFKNNL